MHSLIIVAHPNKQSFSHIVAKTYAWNKNNIRIVDLYDHRYRQDFLQLDENNRPADDHIRVVHQDLIRRSDEIVLCFPLWRFDAPAILKNRFDVNFSSGFAYKYRPGRFFPEKLLHHKHVRIFCTTWGSCRFYNTLGWFLIVLPRRLWRIHYVGLRMKSWTRFCDMGKYRTSDSRIWMVQKVQKIAQSALSS